MVEATHPLLVIDKVKIESHSRQLMKAMQAHAEKKRVFNYLFQMSIENDTEISNHSTSDLYSLVQMMKLLATPAKTHAVIEHLFDKILAQINQHILDKEAYDIKKLYFM